MRGRFRSREFASVVREAENLARNGVAELTIVGQDTSSYGEDLGLRDGLASLLRELGKIPELVWVRFLYCYPNRLTDALIATVAETPKVAKYIDVPLQHASAPVLKSMRRGSSGENFLPLIERIRAAIPEVTLRTSLIVGFPGETEEDFQLLLSFVEAAQFDHLGVFLYSNEETSSSYALPGQVPLAVVGRRRQKLMALQRRISRAKLRQRIGRSFPVLVEGRCEETELLFQGRLESQAPGIDGRVLINDFEGSEPRPGEFRWATITAAGDYDLVSRLEARNFAVRAVPDSPSPVGSRMVQIQPAAMPAV
jgi:ribosomal protein S12 methylthiotransferase